jgi:anti-anti-sigma factor
VVFGELDLSTAPELDRALSAADGDIVIDLRGVEFIDSSGIHALLRACRARPRLRVENPTPAARRVLDLVGVTKLLIDDQPARERI